MRICCLLLITVTATATCFWLSPGRADAPRQEQAAATPEQIEFFEKKIRPVFVEHCYECHSKKAPKRRAGLFLDSRAGILKGGDTGPLFTPGKPEDSLLIEAIAYKNAGMQMPKKGKLPDSVIADLTAWVKMGGPVPADSTTVADDKPAFDLQKRKHDHWAWQPIRAAEQPTVKNKAWVTSPVDAFILAKLEAQNLKPAEAADRRALIRRVNFDLIGLPPTPAEVDAFLKDDAPDAYEKVVDRLLASPHFGERWARHWFDLVRYADSRGHEFDYTIPNAYQYRDYVIRAFNADVPYNQFVLEQVAGDVLAQPRLHPTEGFNESILGTAFWLLGEEVHSPVDVRQDQADRFDNRIDVFGKTFLGMTVACARCHDHKFDAISAKDYYALYGLLESSSSRQVRFDSWESNRKVAAGLAELRDQSEPRLKPALGKVVRPLVDKLGAYLLAAREGILAAPEMATQPHGKPKLVGVDQFDAAFLSKLQAIADDARLDADLLTVWVATLLNAVQDPGDPLYPWARVAADSSARNPRRLVELLKPLADSRNGAEPKKDDVVIDYAHCPPDNWLPDDVAYGRGPVLPGKIRVTGAPGKSQIRLTDYAAAEIDPFWDRLKAAPGTEGDSGALGGMNRGGRTIRTPNFKVGPGKLFYLVRGAGMAYASVDGHALIAGPLHGQLVLDIPASASFRWVAHDLTPYKGQNVHVEFTAAPGGNFAIAQVIQGQEVPRPQSLPNGIVLKELGSENLTLEKFADAYDRAYRAALGRQGSDKLLDNSEAMDDARLINSLGKPALLAKSDQGARKDLEKAADAYLAEMQKLAAGLKPESRTALALQDGNGVDERVFIRGNPQAPGLPAPRRFLEALAGPDALQTVHGSGRLELARQLIDPTVNPLVTRVIVNRLWHHLFGRGLVASVDNLGVLGERPTHPELLDYLADRFTKEGWSIKKMIRELLMTNTYRMSSQPDEQVDRADAQDLLLHRMRVRRLEGEAIRDAILAISGRLNTKLGGPPVPIHLTPFLEGRGRPISGPLDGDGRRSIYLAIRRNFLSPFLLTFDTPSPFSTMGRRSVSNVPAQALVLLNDPFVHQQAEVWAGHVLAGKGSDRERITEMYLSAFSRPPTDVEVGDCLEFLVQQRQKEGKKGADRAAWADLAHVLFNVKEFIFLN